MTDVLIGLADQNMVADLTAILQEIDDLSVKGVARTTSELADLSRRLQPDIVMVHGDIGPEPVTEVIRDLTGQRPEAAVLELSPTRTSTTVIKALEAGARGVIAYPFSFEDVSSRLDVAADWVATMRKLHTGTESTSRHRGKAIAVVGAKGGVGTTTVATHLAQDHVTSHPEDRVCLVDVDVEKGDVAAILEVRQSVSIADVAKVAEDLSAQTVLDAVILHETGIHVLLAPVDVREADLVTPEALRSIIEVLRREFDVVILDGGGHVSPSQAAIVEIADEVLVVTTADVMAVRAMRRRLLAWSALAVGEEAELRVLVNKVDKTSIFPAAAVERLTTARVLDTRIPMSTRLLETAQNERDPRAVTEVAWWRLMSAIRRELGLERVIVSEAPVATRAKVARGGKGGRRSRREAGAIALENAAAIPLALVLAVLCWQIAVTGLTFIWAGHATSTAARTLSVQGSTANAATAARDSVPSAFGSGLSVSRPQQDTVSVTMHIPMTLSGAVGLPTSLTTTRSLVSEP